MYTYYCKTCNVILVNWSVLESHETLTELTYEVYENINDGEIKYTIEENHVETETLDDSTETIGKLCICCRNNILDEVYVEHESLVEIITLLKSDKYKPNKERFFYGLPIEYKERYTKQDIDLAIFEFKLTNV